MEFVGGMIPYGIPGRKTCIRLWETTAEKGIGGWLSPWQTRRKGRALADVRRDEILMLAQTARDVENIQAGGRASLPTINS